MAAIVYHAPFPLDRRAASASGIRPVRMLDAFRELDFEVLTVTGSARERSRRLCALRARLEGGQSIEFLYSESATIPTMLTEPRHLPPHPLLDPALMRLVRRHGVPTALFYRDIYWAFPDYRERVGAAVAGAMSLVYRYDLAWYSHYIDRLYIPSSRMGPHVPGFPAERMAPLPPGCQVVDGAEPCRSSGGLHLLYIGGLGGHYRLEECLRAVTGVPGASLTICTRAAQWEAAREQYAPLVEAADGRIDVVHGSGQELEALYERADACVLFVEPDPYREFAAPVKLYEYLGHGKPVIASAGTLAAETVAACGAGWTPPYDAAELAGLLRRLLTAPDAVEEAAGRARQARAEHTWLRRAHTVVEDMRAVRAGELPRARAPRTGAGQ